MLDTYRRNNKRRAKVPLKKYVPLTLFVTFACERELETEHNCNILTPTLMAVSVVSFLYVPAPLPYLPCCGAALQVIHRHGLSQHRRYE